MKLEAAMTDYAPQPALAHLPVAVAAEGLTFSVPARHNPRLQALADRLNADDELRALWRCANVNAVERLGLGDSGEVHVRIVANAALKLLRLLRDGGQSPALVVHHRLAADDAEVVVVLAAALHELGLAVQAETPSAAGMALAAGKGRELLASLYPARERTIVLAEALHAIVALDPAVRCLTLEAGALRLAHVLDLTKGRARFTPGAVRSVNGAAQVEEVSIQRSHQPPVRVTIRLSPGAGLAGLDAYLQARLGRCGLEELVGFQARVPSPGGDQAVPLNLWPAAAR
jgi:uncharacterized protein